MICAKAKWSSPTVEGWTPRPAPGAGRPGRSAPPKRWSVSARAEFLHAKVVDPYLVAVEIAAEGAPRPRHYREALRALGPSVRPDLGKQADFQI